MAIRARRQAWGVRIGLAAGLVVGIAAVSAAQSVVNPSRLLFDHDPLSRAETTQYRIGYFAINAPQPTHTVDLPKEQTSPEGASFAAALPRPAIGQWQVRVQACAGTLCSDWSQPSDPFGFAPLAPVALRVVR